MAQRDPFWKERLGHSGTGCSTAGNKGGLCLRGRERKLLGRRQTATSQMVRPEQAGWLSFPPARKTMTRQGEIGNLRCAKADGSGLWPGTGATSAMEQSPGLRSGGRAGAQANLGAQGPAPAAEPDGKHRTCWTSQTQLQVEEGPLLLRRLSQGCVQECGEVLSLACVREQAAVKILTLAPFHP